MADLHDEAGIVAADAAEDAAGKVEEAVGKVEEAMGVQVLELEARGRGQTDHSRLMGLYKHPK